MLIGNVGKDPVVRHTENGTPVATFSLATTERYKDKNGVLKEITEWHNIVCWRALADFSEKYVRKGSSLYIEGKLRSRSWDGQDGQKKYTTEIMADNMQFVGRKGDDLQTSGGYRNEQEQYPQQGAGIQDMPQTADDSIDDLPF